MTNDELHQKALEIANLLFSSEELYIPRVEFNNHLQGEFEKYNDLIREALCSITKITKQQGRTGGIRFVDGRSQRSTLAQVDITSIKKKIDLLFKDYKEQSARTRREKPEKEVENAFTMWLKNQKTDDNFKDTIITSFRPDARKGDKWQNVDGYSLRIETLKYHLSFKPILTTFEVKAILPKMEGIAQSKHYQNFSHYVYLVFRFDGNAEALKKVLDKNGYSSKEGVGIYFTQDGTDFECLFTSHRGNPSEKNVDEAIEKILSENDKETLLSNKYKYIIEDIFIPAIL